MLHSTTKATRNIVVSIIVSSGILYTFIFLRPDGMQPVVDHLFVNNGGSSSNPSRLTTPNTFLPVSNDTRIGSDDGRTTWIFNATRDERAFGLTSEKCSTAFPGIFEEINRAVTHATEVGGITSMDVDVSWSDEGVVRAMILDQQLYILEQKISSSDFALPRGLAILHAIHRSLLTSPTPLPNIEFSFSVSDVSDPKHLHYPIWSLSRTSDEPEKWLMSDFGYWSWPLDLIGSYEQVRKEIRDTEWDFEDKIKMAVWRGSVKSNHDGVRQSLVEVTAGKPWADVKDIRWQSASRLSNADEARALSMPEHCQYQFVIQTEGNSYSGRGKYLQNCNSVVIMHKRKWIEPQHSLLISSGPEQNFVEVENDFSDLEDKIEYLLAHPDEAERIAANGVKVFRDRYLTPAAQTCYWRKMIEGWAEVSFEPEEWEETETKRKIRGIPFETFVVQAIKPKRANCSWVGRVFLQC